MKFGTIVKLPDGRKATVVYHNLDGYGIVYGEPTVTISEPPKPEAMLRGTYSNPTAPCIGTDYTIVSQTDAS